MPSKSGRGGRTPTTVTGSPSRRIVCPTTLGFDASWVRQNRSEAIATRGAPRLASSSVKLRPAAGRIWKNSTYPVLTSLPLTRTGRSTPDRLKERRRVATIWSTDVARLRQSRKSAGDTARFVSDSPRLCDQIATRRSMSSTGRETDMTPATKLNTAVVAPIPSASVKTAEAVTAGARRNCRKPILRSRSRWSTMRLRGSQETSNSYWDTEVRVGSFGTVGNPIVNGPDARGVCADSQFTIRAAGGCAGDEKDCPGAHARAGRDCDAVGGQLAAVARPRS